MSANKVKDKRSPVALFLKLRWWKRVERPVLLKVYADTLLRAHRFACGRLLKVQTIIIYEQAPACTSSPDGTRKLAPGEKLPDPDGSNVNPKSIVEASFIALYI